MYPGAKEEMYKYEVQIAQKPNNGISGVTYSYKSTEFYGKATMQGIYSVPSKSLIIKGTNQLPKPPIKIGITIKKIIKNACPVTKTLYN